MNQRNKSALIAYYPSHECNAIFNNTPFGRSALLCCINYIPGEASTVVKTLPAVTAPEKGDSWSPEASSVLMRLGKAAEDSRNPW